MKAMTWVLKRSDGGEIEIEQPPSKYNFYRDIAVIAYPARRPAKPEAADKIQSSLLIGCALAEATAVYGLVIGIMLILFS